MVRYYSVVAGVASSTGAELSSTMVKRTSVLPSKKVFNLLKKRGFRAVT